MIQKNLDYDTILDKTKEQFFVFESLMPRPLFFIKHTYIVTNQKGKINRYEVWQSKNKKVIKLEHLRKNRLKPIVGFKKSYFNRNKRFTSKIIGFETGNLAEQINEFVNKNYTNYKYKDKYNYLGNNCNTFVDWILKQFPQSKIKLPFMAIGKKYN